MNTRAGAPPPSAPHAPGLPLNTALMFPLPHPLKLWGLRESRGGSRDHWRVHIKKSIGSIPLVDITQTQVDQWHQGGSRSRGRYTANGAFDALRAAINWQI